jgi:hypothetical protein
LNLDFLGLDLKYMWWTTSDMKRWDIIAEKFGFMLSLEMLCLSPLPLASWQVLT